MTPELSNNGIDAVHIIILSSWFSGVPFAYIAFLLNRRVGWKGDDARVLFLSLAVGGGFLWLLMQLIGNTGLWPAVFAMVGWYGGMRYGARANERRRRRRFEGPDRTQRLLFEQMTRDADERPAKTVAATETEDR
jgi:hypothetical protein